MAQANPQPNGVLQSKVVFPSSHRGTLALACAIALLCASHFSGCSKKEIPEIQPGPVLESKKPEKTNKKEVADTSAQPAAVAKSGSNTVATGSTPKTPATAQKSSDPAPAANKKTRRAATTEIGRNSSPAKVVVSQATGTRALKDIGEWSKAPAFLQDAQVYHRIPRRPPAGDKDALKINEVEFSVEQAGVVILLASWTPDGSVDRNWFPTRTTKQMLERDGWRVLGETTMTDSRDLRHKYTIYARHFDAGAEVRFHTRKITPPMVVVLDADRLTLAFGGTPARQPADQPPATKQTPAATPGNATPKVAAVAKKNRKSRPALPAAAKSIDLLKHVDPQSDSVGAAWKLAEGGLLSPDRPHAKLRIADEVPAEYDLRLTVERLSGTDALFVGAPVDGHQVPCYFDVSSGLPAPYTGLGTVNGQGPNLRSNSRKGQLLKANVPTPVEVVVRKGTVSLKVGTAVVFEWRGDSSPYQIPSLWSIPQRGALYLGSSRSQFRITKLELINPNADEPVAKTVARQPVPSEAEQKQALALVNAIFRAERSAAKTAEKRIELARKMLAQLNATNSTVAGRYVLMQEARTLAIQAGDTDLAMEIVERIARSYTIDVFSEKLESLRRIAPLISSKSNTSNLPNTALELAQSALAETRYAVSLELIKLARTTATKSRQSELATKIVSFRRKLMLLKKWDAESVKAAKTLELRPEHPQANLELGRFLCFVKQDWPGGLRLLVKGADEDLKKVAALDLAAPSRESEIVALGNAWWDLGKKQNSNSFLRTLYHTRAEFWYGQIASRLSGLQKTLIEKRLKEIAAAKATP